MKLAISLLFLNMTLISSAFAATPYKDADYSCVVTSEDRRYDDIFIIEVREKGLSKVKYKRVHLNSDGQYGEAEIVRGCYHAKQVVDEHYPENITVECAMGGEEGIVSINSKTLEGDIYFYMPKIGYGERMSLNFSCQQI